MDVQLFIKRPVPTLVRVQPQACPYRSQGAVTDGHDSGNAEPQFRVSPHLR